MFEITGCSSQIQKVSAGSRNESQRPRKWQMRNQCCLAAKSTTSCSRMGHPTPRQSCHWALQREDRWPWTAPTGGPLDNVQRCDLIDHFCWDFILLHRCHTHIIHISYTHHTHIIHISYTYHTHIIHISYTYHTHIIHISYTYHTHPRHSHLFLWNAIFLVKSHLAMFLPWNPEKKCWSPVTWRQRNSPWRLARRCCARRHRRSAEAGVAARGQPRQLPWDSKHLGYLKDLNPNKDSADSSWVSEPWSCSCTLLIWVHNNPQLWLPPSHVMILYPQVAFKWLQ